MNSVVRWVVGAAVTLLLLAGSPAWAAAAVAAPTAPQVSGPLMLVMDASGSMNADAGGQAKLEAAKQALRGVVNTVPEGAPVGLLVYGHRVGNRTAERAAGCRDTEVVVPAGPLDRSRMLGAIDRYSARGYTPIGRSLQDAAAALPAEGGGTIVLVSDGVDTCTPPDPCQVARDLDGAGIDLVVETVGFQVDPAARAQLECIAGATGGQYRDAADAEALAGSLVELSTRAVRSYDPQGQPVSGAPSYQNAPLLTPGSYSDTVLAQEELWYAVELGPGEELVARSTLVIDDGDFGGVGALYEIQLVDPLLDDMCCEEERGYEVNVGIGGGDRTVNIAARSGVVGTEDSNAVEPGRYYIRIVADGDGSAEYPIDLAVDVTGDGAAGQPTTTTEAPTSAAAPTASDVSTRPTAQDDGSDTAVWLVGALTGALIVAFVALVVFLNRLQRRSR